jgi:DNA-binding NtrC family response regulator
MNAILLVDDDPAILKYLTETLRKYVPEARELLTADSVSSAEVILATHSCDILVTDVYLGKESGLDLIPPAKESNPCLQVIAISGTQSLELIRLAAARGVSDFVVKPLECMDLVLRIQQAGDRVKNWQTAIGDSVGLQLR